MTRTKELDFTAQSANTKKVQDARLDRRKILLFFYLFASLGLWDWNSSDTVLAALLPPAAVQNSSQSAAIPIRLRLAKAVPQAVIRGMDLSLYEAGSRWIASPNLSSEWTIRCQKGRIRATPGRGSGKPLDLQSPLKIESRAGYVKYKGQSFREKIWIHSSNSTCEVINELNIEGYLKGLVNGEFSSKWNENAVLAQVVAARTYAYYQIQHARQNHRAHYDLDISVRDQVYLGPDREDSRASRSVELTRGTILTADLSSALRSPAQSSPAPIKAFYHSTCGGTTELPEHVWGGAYPGFKRTVRCPFCATSPRFNWRLELTRSDIGLAIQKGAHDEGAPPFWPRDWSDIIVDSSLEDLWVSKLDRDGRVAEVSTLWRSLKPGAFSKTQFKIPGARFRDWVGAARLRSTQFLVRSRSQSLISFEGRGNGHGVGMCQWGAKVMGEKGHSMVAILKHYYPDAVLRKLW